MGFNVNGPNNVGGANFVNGLNNIKSGSFLNTVFGNKNGNFVPNTPFNGEEQHILGVFATFQNNVLIED